MSDVYVYYFMRSLELRAESRDAEALKNVDGVHSDWPSRPQIA